MVRWHIRSSLLIFFFLSSFFMVKDACLAVDDYVDIRQPFLRKIPIAIPFFKPISGSETELKVSEEASLLLSKALNFTGYFKLLDSGAFLADPNKMGIVGPSINFRNWTAIGAELIVTGGVAASGQLIEMELRLYDTFKERLIVGKRYKGMVNDQRRIIHRFSSEIIYHLTGTRGIFDSKIAFVSDSSGNKEIYYCDFDGFNLKQITRNKSINLTPAWSSDGEKIAYTSYARGKPDIYIKNIKGKRGAVVANKGINISPSWVPGRNELAAALSFSGDQEIYLLTPKGKIINRLTNKRGIDLSPSFSPDGKKMAFVSKRSGSPQIYIKNLESGHVERLTFIGKNNTQPSWSPRGHQIVYTAFIKGQININVIGIDGKGPVSLTHNEGENESASWSPDGSMIVFSSTRDGAAKIYVMTAFGTDQRKLLDMPKNQTEPTWSLNIIEN